MFCLNVFYVAKFFQHYYTMNEFPADVEKKVKLLNYFKNYMREHLLKAGANMEVIQEEISV